MRGMQCNVELDTDSTFALGRRKSTENIGRFGREQDLPNAY
jgi:hypothetical protein